MLKSGLRGSSILKRLQDTCPNNYIVRVCACDTLPAPFAYWLTPAIIVVNTHTSSLPGEHWIAIITQKNNPCIVFDSLRIAPIPTVILRWVYKYSAKNYILPMNIIQHPFSHSCGLFCIYFIEQLLVHQVSLPLLLNKFDYKDPTTNETLIADYFKQ